MTRFEQAIQYLLPQGWAWPRDAGAVWMRLIYAWAAVLAEHDEFVAASAVDWLPHATTTRLAEWEAATGLPDACLGLEQSVDQRRDQVLLRLRGMRGVYADSSPAAPRALEDLCAAAGVTAAIRYNTPFRVSRNRMGERMGARDGKLTVVISGSASSRFRMGDRMGQRLITYPPSVAAVRCILERVVPARFEINAVAV